MAATARSTLVPALVVTAVVLAFYTWASHGATLEQPDFDSLATGQPAAASQAGLPEHQARVRLTPTVPTPPRVGVPVLHRRVTFPWPWPPTRSATTVTLTRVSDLRRTPLR